MSLNSSLMSAMGMSSALGPAAMGLNIAGSLFGAIGARKDRKAAERYAKQVEENTMQDVIQQFSSMGRRAQDVIAAGQGQLRNVARVGSIQQGIVTAAAGAAGVTGNSYDALLNDFTRTTLSQAAATKADINVELENLESQKQAMAAQASSRINQARSSVPQKQNLFGTLLQIGSSALMTQQAFK